MKRPLAFYGNPVLREQARPVATVDAAVRALADDLLDTMYASDGVGLAAEQIGRTERVCVVDVRPAKPVEGRPPEPEPPVPMPVVLVNPRILSQSGEQVGPEGCLSVPEIYVSIRRAAQVRVAYTDLDNQTQEFEAEGMLARAIQHEIDHLDGVLFVDRMSAAQRIGISGKLKRLKRKTEEALETADALGT